MLSEMKIKKDIVIIGGGLAGICAAISAAKNGASVALVHERPALGGNSSSEIRMVPLGATGGGNKFAEEMGIIGALKLESLYKNPSGNAHLWDAILLDNILKEPNISLYLNTSIVNVRVQDGRITEVSGFQQVSETSWSFEGSLFIGCTGDGTIGFLAGAEYMRGRESKAQFGESFAMERPDRYTMGHTIYFESRDTGKPVKYIKPDFAYSWDKNRRNYHHRGP